MRTIFQLLHLRQLRRQPLRALLAVIAIGAGVTLTVAVLTARSSLDRSFGAYNTALGSQASLRVVSRYDHGGIDASVLSAVEQTEGVQNAVPLVLSVGQMTDGHDHKQLIALVGADCRAEAIFGASGCDPAAIANAKDTDPPIVGSGVHTAAGPDGVLHTDIGDRPLRDAPVVPALDHINDGRIAVYPLPVAQTLFARPNGLDAIYVVPKPGVSTDVLRRSLAPVVGEQNKVLGVSESYSGFSFVANQILPILLLISLFGLAVGAQLVFNTMSLSLEERRRELAIEAALGGTPRAILLGVLGEAAVLGALGGAAGIAMGLVVARPFIGTISTYAEQSAGIHLSAHITLANTLIGLAIGILASVVAALVPARRAARLDIAGELVDRSRRDDASPRIRARRSLVLGATTVLGLVLAWLGSRHHGLESWAPTVLLAGVFMVWISTYPLPPSLAPYAVRWIEKIPFLQRGPARVAVSNLATETRRSTTVLVAVGSAVGLAAMFGGVLPGMRDGAQRRTRDTANGRVMVATLTPNNNGAIDGKLAPTTQAQLAQLPGVARVEHVYHANVDLPGAGLVGIAGGDGDPSGFRVYRGVSFKEAKQRGEVMVGPALARELDLSPGKSFTIPGRQGPVTLVVGGIWAAPDDLGRSITAAVEVFERIAGPRPVDWVLLVPQPGVSAAQLAVTVRAAHLAPNVRAWDPDELVTELSHDFEGFIAPFNVLARGLLVVAFIATASTLLLAGVKRRAEHGLLAAVGMPPGDLARMVLVEAGLFGLLGTLGGLFGGLIGLLAFCMASTSLTGLYIPFHLSLLPLFTSGLIATACVLAGAALPAWRTSRLDPVVALRYE